MAAEDTAWGGFLQATLLAMLEAANEGLVVFDVDGRCRMIGRRAGEIFGIEPAANVGKMRQEVLGAFARACEDPQRFLGMAGGDDTAVVSPVLEVEVRRPRPRTVVCKTSPMVRDGRRLGRILIFDDVTRERTAERTARQLQSRIVELTAFDALTGLLNHRRFREDLDREHGRSTRAWDSYAILRMDVDRMGIINDEFGRPVGDQVLERVATRLKACLRDYDVLARLEADEFGVLLPGADEVAARAVAARVFRNLQVEELKLDELRRVTLSIGCAVWVPPSGESTEDILRRARHALDEAREEGGSQIHVDPPPTDEPPPLPRF